LFTEAQSYYKNPCKASNYRIGTTMNKQPIEEGTAFSPRFDHAGLIPCITTEASTGKVLMLAWMNHEALEKTMETREAHYWSRNRRSLWHKGAESGAVQKVLDIRVDCDQDSILLLVEVASSPEKTCHTGRDSCFYRSVLKDGSLKFTDK
jgi:phosphoribosyl-AMP cyclohydrolase